MSEAMLRGAQLALQAMGINDRRERTRIMDQFRTQQMGLSLKQEGRAAESHRTTQKIKKSTEQRNVEAAGRAETTHDKALKESDMRLKLNQARLAATKSDAELHKIKMETAQLEAQAKAQEIQRKQFQMSATKQTFNQWKGVPPSPDMGGPPGMIDPGRPQGTLKDLAERMAVVSGQFGDTTAFGNLYGKLTKEPTKPRAAQNYILPDKSVVSSLDGGRTYSDANGVRRQLPYGSIKMSATFTGDDLRLLKTQQEARGQLKEQEDLPGQPAPRTAEQAKEIAVSGTGPWSTVAATIDAVIGGAGVDKIFGANGIFPNIQENRQVLRTIKQMGKAALLNSSRGATWEQKRIDDLFPDPDKIFTNPRTEANKFKTLRDTMLMEKLFNTRAIMSAVSPKEANALKSANVQIDRLLSKIGGGVTASDVSDEDTKLLNMYLQQ